MRPPLQSASVSLVALLALVAPAASRDKVIGSDPASARPQFVRVSPPRFSTVTTVYSADADSAEFPVRPRIKFDLINASTRPFWLAVDFQAPPPHPGRRGTVHLEPGQKVEFQSTQDEILADTDYRVALVACSDSAFTDTLEQSAVQMRFDAHDVKELMKGIAEERRNFDQNREAGHLPKMYDNLIFVENHIGLGGTLFSPRGMLTVKPDGLEYVSKKRTVTVPAASLRDVGIVEEQSAMCVAVAYDEGGQPKRALFVPGITRSEGGFLPRIEASIRSAMRQVKKPE